MLRRGALIGLLACGSSYSSNSSSHAVVQHEPLYHRSHALCCTHRSVSSSSHSASEASGPDTINSTSSPATPSHPHRTQRDTGELWTNLRGMVLSVRPPRQPDVSADKPLALGTLVERVANLTYRARIRRVAMPASSSAPDARSEATKVENKDSAQAMAGSTHSAIATTMVNGKAPMAELLSIGTRAQIIETAPEADGAAPAVPHAGMEGFILRVNGNASYTMLMENDTIVLAVPPANVRLTRAPSKILHNVQYTNLVTWLQSAVDNRRDCQAMAFALYYRGWRIERLYLLEKADVASMTFVPKRQQAAVLEKAQWERDHHNVIRLLHRERVKDRDWRYALSKYKGTISCIAGVCVVSYVFTANLRAYRSQQRGYQLKLAARAVAGGATSMPIHHHHHHHSALSLRDNASGTGDGDVHVTREAEEEAVQRVLRQLDTAHPRIIVLTGYAGCGKSSVCRAAIEKEGMPALYVDIRGPEDTLRSVVKALGVQNIEVCGDLLDFVAEALQLGSKSRNAVPLLVIKLRDAGSLERVYKEAIGLVSHHHACHLVLEVPLESLTMANTSLPRLDFYTVPNFTPAQAYEYTQHSIDPVSLAHFIDVAGTNSNDLDELFAAVRQREVDVVAYTSVKLMKAMRRLSQVVEGSAAMCAAVKQLARVPFSDGLADSAVDQILGFRALAENDVVLYDPVQDRWLFTQQILHTAARCCDL